MTEPDPLDLADVMYVWPMVIKKIYLGDYDDPDPALLSRLGLQSTDPSESVHVQEALVHAPQEAP
jgi:hypothetical protein